jgi:hypothetical protein
MASRGMPRSCSPALLNSSKRSVSAFLTKIIAGMFSTMDDRNVLTRSRSRRDRLMGSSKSPGKSLLEA